MTCEPLARVSVAFQAEPRRWSQKACSLPHPSIPSEGVIRDAWAAHAAALQTIAKAIALYETFLRQLMVESPLGEIPLGDLVQRCIVLPLPGLDEYRPLALELNRGIIRSQLVHRQA